MMRVSAGVRLQRSRGTVREEKGDRPETSVRHRQHQLSEQMRSAPGSVL